MKNYTVQIFDVELRDDRIASFDDCRSPISSAQFPNIAEARAFFNEKVSALGQRKYNHFDAYHKIYIAEAVAILSDDGCEAFWSTPKTRQAYEDSIYAEQLAEEIDQDDTLTQDEIDERRDEINSLLGVEVKADKGAFAESVRAMR